MTDKKYYWLKFQSDFFKSLRIKKLRRLAGGDTYTIIYLKLQLLSLKTDGVLEYKGIFESFAEEMAEEIDEDIENVQVTINYLLSCGLMEQSDNSYYLPYVAENTGSETRDAERKRIKRAELKALSGQSTDNVRLLSESVQKCPTEKEKEIEKDIEIEIDKDKEKRNILSSSAKEIIDYLNSVLGSNYKSTTDKTRHHISARLDEGFTVDDFKTVIDKKYEEWHDNEMSAYLRPETLFGTKFESYLNQTIVKKPKSTKKEPSNTIQDELEALRQKWGAGNEC